MDLAWCQDPCFPFPTQCTLNNTSFLQQGPPGPVLFSSPAVQGSVSVDGSHHGGVGTSGLPLVPVAVDRPFPALRRSEGPAVGLPATPRLSCGEQGALQHFSRPLPPTGMIQT